MNHRTPPGATPPRVRYMQHRRSVLAMLVAGAMVSLTVTSGSVRAAQSTTSGNIAGTSFLSGPNPGKPLDIATKYLKDNGAEAGLSAADFADFVVTDQYADADTGVTHIYLRQRVEAIDVVDAVASVNIARDGSVINASTAFVPGAAEVANTTSPRRNAAQGVGDGAAAVKLVPKGQLKVRKPSKGKNQETEFDDPDLSKEPIRTKLVFARDPDGKALKLAWSTRIREHGGKHWWEIITDANDGTSLAIDDYVDEETSSHNVFPLPLASPYDGPRSVVVNPADATASPFGWNDTNGVSGPESTLTTGNNVLAATDLNDDEVPDPGSLPDGGPGLDFNLPVDLTLEPDTYRPFSVSNLFYWNNVIHDVAYGYGFTEAAGNFQVNNYGRGGAGGDAVQADSQDGSGTDNANFATPPDGQQPRMQMYIWSAPAPKLQFGASQFNALQFGRAAKPPTAGLAGIIEQVQDNTVISTDGCQPLVGFTAGHIALIDRSDQCNFTSKVVNAVAAGASGVVFANYASGAFALTLNQDFSIPVIGISQADGAAVRAAAPTPVTMFGSPRLDSSLDAEIIVHEYAHGVSNRLTGGPSDVSCLNNAEQMGEGWSDFLSLQLTAGPGAPLQTRGVGSYALGLPAHTGAGIRPTAYSPDMSINPTTYDTIKNTATISQPHGIGYVWASMLWDMNWALVGTHGYNPDIRAAWSTGGNNLALQLVLDGMKLQPCRPGFVDGRDAILAADMVRTGGANVCTIWNAFARRGLGVEASQGLSSSRSDGVQSFVRPSGCDGGPKPDLALTGATAQPQTIGQPQPISYTITNAGAGPTTNTKFVIPAVAGLALVAAVPSAGTCSAASGGYNCSIGAMGAAATASVAVTMIPLAQGLKHITATVSTAGLEDGLANNSSDVTIDPYGLLVSSSTTTDDNCAILDNTTIECPLTVAETATIVSAEVRVRIAHTFDSDLIISAVAPDGTAVLLSNGRGGGADDFGTGPDPCSSGATVPTTFSDGAATAIGSGVAPFAGTFRPEATLSALSGHSPTGVWKLRVRDRFPADQGTVLCWGVDLKTTIPPVAAGLLYTGATTVQHSDPVNVAAHFASSASSPVSNEAIALTFGTQSTSGTTNATGDATGSFVVTQTPGAATATATFAGNRATNLLPASDTKPVVIAKEDCMLSYTGNTLVNAATATTLSAQFWENDSTPGTWTDKPVVFTVTDAALVVQTFSALTNAAGVASLAAPLGSNVYGVSVSFAGDDFYNPCATDPAADTIVTVQAAEAKITGGGWTTTAAGRSSFGFNVISDVTGLRGQLQIRAANAKGKFHAPTALTLSSAKPNGTWTGTGRWNGETGYSFTATVFDGGANGKKTDTISIVVKRITDNLVVFTTGGATALKGGNIIVR